MKRFSILALSIGLILSSCTERASKPKPFLSEKKMVELLTELHLAEAKLQQMQNYTYGLDSSRLYTIAVYNELFEKFGLNQESFEANLYYRTYYSRDLENIYIKVDENLQRMGEQEREQNLELHKQVLENNL